MIRSANEVAAMVAKAARGAGLPLGLAEELAAAIPAYVAGQVDPVLHALLGHLAEPDALGAHIAALDDCEAAGSAMTESECPCLTCLTQARFRVAIAGGPLDVSPEVWRALEDYAALTYVPASEASRSTGAGAGLTDND